MVETQLEDLDARELWADIDEDELSLRLFDLELATEHLVGAGARTAGADGAALSVSTRDELLRALRELQAGLRESADPAALRQAGARADRVCDDATVTPTGRGLALAVRRLITATERTRALATRPGVSSRPTELPDQADEPPSALPAKSQPPTTPIGIRVDRGPRAWPPPAGRRSRSGSRPHSPSSPVSCSPPPAGTGRSSTRS